MNDIKLDASKLLGFKIIADGGSTVRLTSPKIGDKGGITPVDQAETGAKSDTKTA